MPKDFTVFCQIPHPFRLDYTTYRGYAQIYFTIQRLHGKWKWYQPEQLWVRCYQLQLEADLVFDGWFTAPTGGTQVATNTPIHNNTTLYARWTANPTISASRSTWTITANLAWTVSSSNPSWLTATPTGGTNSGEFTIHATGNASPNQRTGTITVTAPGAPTRIITVTQFAGFRVTFNPHGGIVSPTHFYRYQGARMGELPIPTREGFVFVGWFTSVTGGTQITPDTTVIAGATSSALARWTAATSTLLLSQSEWNIPSSAPASTVVTVTSNVAWTASTPSSWFDILHADGSGNGNSVHVAGTGSFRITATGNSTSAPRSGTITIAAAGLPSQTITVTQSAGVRVTFDLRGGHGIQTTAYRYVGARLGDLPTPNRGGFAFVGWSTTANGPINVTPDTIVNGNMTIFARWHQLVNMQSGIFRLRGPDWLFLRPTGNMAFTLANIDNTIGSDLWWIEPVGGGYYTIESLGLISVDNGLSPNLLTGAASIGAPTGLIVLTTPNNGHNQHWRIQRDGDYHFFVNRQFPTLMIGRSGASPNMTNDVSQAGWRMESYVRPSSWQGRYTGSPTSGRVNVAFGVRDSARTGYLTMNEVYSYGVVWNGISSNVHVTVVPIGTMDLYHSWGIEAHTFYVMVEGFNFLPDPFTQLQVRSGEFQPRNAQGLRADLNEPWSSGIIRMCIGENDNSLRHGTLHYRQAAFIHEIGHALKLDHPQRWQSATNTNMFPAWRPVANMNYTGIAYRLRGYDKFNLMSKWGR